MSLFDLFHDGLGVPRTPKIPTEPVLYELCVAIGVTNVNTSQVTHLINDDTAADHIHHTMLFPQILGLLAIGMDG